MTDDDAYEAYRDSGVLVPHPTDEDDGFLYRRKPPEKEQAHVDSDCDPAGLHP